MIVTKRGTSTKTEIELSIMESESEMKKAMRNSFDDFFARAESSLNDILRTRKEQYKTVLEDMDRPVEDLDKTNVLNDLKYVVSVLDRTKES